MSLVSARCVYDTVEAAFTLDIHVSITVGRVIGVVVGGHSLIAFYLVEVLCYSVLTSVLVLCLSGQVVDHLTRQPDVGHGVEDSSVGNVIADPHDLPVEARLHPVDVVTFPQSHCHEGSADVDQHRSRQTACQLLYHIRVRLPDLPPYHTDVLVDLLPGDLQLLLMITCHLHAQVFHRLHTSDAADFLHLLLRQDLRLLLVEAEVPLLL